MGTYDEVLAVLRSKYNWPIDATPSPGPVAEALETMTPEVVASCLDSSCRSSDAPPYGYPGTSYEWARYSRYVADGKYRVLNTSQALGLQPPDPPLDKVDEAKTASEWWHAQANNRTRLGFKLWDPDDADSLAWHEKLFAAAANVPPEWAIGTDPMIYQLACREGYIQPGMAGFHAAYASQTPRYADVRGLAAQQWLDNLRAADRKMPRPWTPTKSDAKVPA